MAYADLYEPPVVGSKVVELFPGTWRVFDRYTHISLRLFHPSSRSLAARSLSRNLHFKFVRPREREMDSSKGCILMIKDESIFFFFFDAMQRGSRLHISIQRDTRDLECGRDAIIISS